MESSVRRYCDASAVNDLDGLMESLAPDAEVVSPLSARMVFRGTEDLRVVLGAVYGTLTDLRWHEPIGQDAMQVALAEARVGPFKLGDITAFELAPDGRIQRVRPYLRPWLGTTALALALIAQLSRHPGVVSRALR